MLLSHETSHLTTAATAAWHSAGIPATGYRQARTVLDAGRRSHAEQSLEPAGTTIGAGDFLVGATNKNLNNMFTRFAFVFIQRHDKPGSEMRFLFNPATLHWFQNV